MDIKRLSGAGLRRRLRARATLAIVIAVIASVPTASEAHQAASEPTSLAATISRLDPDNLALSVTLRNNNSKAIVAWAFKVEVSTASGQLFAYRKDEDGFVSIDARLRVIEPGAIREVLVGLPQRVSVLDAKVTVEAVVFEDVTSEGAPDVVDRILANRAAYRAETAYWLDVLKQMCIKHGRAGKLEGGIALESLSPAQRRSTTADKLCGPMDAVEADAAMEEYGSKLKAVIAPTQRQKSLLRQLEGTGSRADMDAKGRLEGLARLLEQEYENAVRHSRRPK